MRGFRYWLLFITTAGQTLVYSNRIVFGFTVICQAPKDGNITNPDYYLNDKITEAYMYLSQALGQCSTSIPLYLLGGFGTNVQFLFFGLLSSVATLLFPLADSYGFIPAVIVRFITGLCQSTQLYFTNEMVMRWAPESEKSIFLAVLLSSIQFGPLITMPLGGIMCEKFSWEYTYYVLGFLTLLASIAYFIFFADDVQSSRFCSDEEKVYVMRGKQAHKSKRPPVPYRKLLTDVGVLTNIILFSSYYVGLIVYNQYSPTFLNKVLGYGTMITGYYAAIPMIFAIAVKLLLGKLIDHGMGLSIKWRLAVPTIFFQIFTVLALIMIGMAANRTIVLIALMVFATLAFFAPVISSRTIQIIAGPHAHFVLNANMFLCGIMQILMPLGVHFVVGQENAKSQWSLIFYLVAILAVLCTVMYVSCVDAKLAKWAETPKETEEATEETEKENINRVENRIDINIKVY